MNRVLFESFLHQDVIVRFTDGTCERGILERSPFYRNKYVLKGIYYDVAFSLSLVRSVIF